MQLLFLLLLLVVPFLVLTLADWFSRFRISASTRARVGLSLFFFFTSLGHFIRTEEMAAMLPPAIPYRAQLIHVTGVLEFLGAIGVWIPGLMRLTGVCLILMLVGILPANIYSAINHVDFGGPWIRSGVFINQSTFPTVGNLLDLFCYETGLVSAATAGNLNPQWCCYQTAS